MTLRPLADRVVLKAVEAEETTKTAIVLPGAAQENPPISEVIAVGPGGYDADGNKVEMLVKAGDKVITANFTGSRVKFDGTEYTIVRQNDILAIVD